MSILTNHLSPGAAQAARSTLQAFRSVPRTGVVYVTKEAQSHGYRSGHPEWANLGQGQPEIGPLPGAPPRIRTVEVDPADHEYAPVPGLWELREAVAALYNRLYRRGMPSQYTAENVAISGGGRAALTRAVASLDRVNLGHFLPDYTAYEELLDIFRLVTPIPILLSREAGYRFTADDFRREVQGRGLSVLLLSNPSNPMGKLVSGGELADWIAVGRELDCTLLLDEFYSHYIWQPGPGEPGPVVSAARYVEDVDSDPVVIVDGLTKNWRYPGWRVTWTVGPKQVIEAVESAGSFLDGGGSKPLQRAAIPLMDPDLVLAETQAIRDAFLPKRDLMLARTRAMGMTVHPDPEGTFYAFVSLAGLPEPIADGMAFFRAALERQVICVPGVFFDVNPGHRRAQRLSRFHQHVRLSFGPSFAEVERGLDRLAAMVREFEG
ncbi:MAG: N-succinyldiaminopimelate aminotransferase [Acidobacteriota bacterium]|jgi:aspartate/methionine/tyrosine aminotransferase|nr:N-succinyldiaminopimelate aminotransferase [Acidobacteriota bacterium]